VSSAPPWPSAAMTKFAAMSLPRSAMLAAWRPSLTLSVPLLPLAFAA
jgi:hypothetical protein